ncbi:hypothetical protein AB0G54_39100 [Streptomyces yokosukanensis]|uniref:hypothetical protein n=1 Tax=Streptomyces yokosukanensis TaxID=67386 RepID=UPI00341A972F
MASAATACSTVLAPESPHWLAAGVGLYLAPDSGSSDYSGARPRPGDQVRRVSRLQQNDQGHRFVVEVGDEVDICCGQQLLTVCPRSGEQVPSLTAQIARASNPGGTTAMWV